MAGHGNTGRGRNIALCCAHWSDSSTVHAWTWMKQYLLKVGLGSLAVWRRGSPVPPLHRLPPLTAPTSPASPMQRETMFGQGTRLDPSDHLIIVHVGKGGEKERWKMGGPLIPDLETCLESFPHTIEDLAGSIQGNIREFLDRAKIDIVVFGAVGFAYSKVQGSECAALEPERQLLLGSRLWRDHSTSSPQPPHPHRQSVPTVGPEGPVPGVGAGLGQAACQHALHHHPAGGGWLGLHTR